MPPAFLRGTVIRGSNRGRALGFPTANLELDSPAPRLRAGIYAGRAAISNEPHVYRAAVHIGPRPTFAETDVSIEVHLLDFPHRDLYGQSLTVTDLIWIRPVAKFTSAEELQQAIAADCAAARRLLAARGIRPILPQAGK